MVNLPAAKPNRYVGRASVCPNRNVVRSPEVSRAISGALETATHAAGISRVSENDALMSGWSKHGNACDARAGTKSE